MTSGRPAGQVAHPDRAARYYTGDVARAMIRAGNSVLVYASRRAEGAQGLGRPLGPEDYLRLTPRGHYCSFYEDCWPLE